MNITKRYKRTDDWKDAIYEVVEGYKKVTRDWNCDGDIYTLEVCYVRDIEESHSSYNEPVTRDQFKNYFYEV